MNTKQLVLEAAHTFAIYTMLVPNGRLLKWADVMLFAVDAIENEDEKIREQCAEMFRIELERLTFEPIYALTKAIATNMPNEAKMDDVKKEIEDRRANLIKTANDAKKAIDDAENPDFITLKYQLIDAINNCFTYLNKVQDFQYPEIQPSTTMMPEALKNV